MLLSDQAPEFPVFDFGEGLPFGSTKPKPIQQEAALPRQGRSWALASAAGAADVSLPKKKEVVVEGLELFAAVPALADDGYARWKAEVAAERTAQEAAQRTAELPTAENEKGYVEWKAETQAMRRAFERRWGIPFGKCVRVQLRGEPREREGVLRVVEAGRAKTASKQLRLRLGDHEFISTSIESLVRV